MGLFSKKDPAKDYCKKGIKIYLKKPEKGLFYFRKAMELGDANALDWGSLCLFKFFPHTQENLEQAAEWQWQYIVTLHRNGSFILDSEYARWVKIWAELCKLLGQPWGCGTMDEPWKEMLTLLTTEAEMEEKKCPANVYYRNEGFLIDLYLKGHYEYQFQKFASIRETYDVWTPDEEKGLYWMNKALKKYEKKRMEGTYTKRPDMCMISVLEYLMEKTPQDYETALPYLHYYFQEEFYLGDPAEGAKVAQYLVDYYREIGDSKNAGIWEYNRDLCKHNAVVDEHNAALKKAAKSHYYVTMDEYSRLSSLRANVEYTSKDLEERRKELESMEQDE